MYNMMGVLDVRDQREWFRGGDPGSTQRRLDKDLSQGGHADFDRGPRGDAGRAGG